MKTPEQKRQHAQYMRLYRAKNLEKARATDRASKLRNRDKVLVRKAAYRKAAAAKIRGYNAEYQRKNAVVALAWRKRWAKDHPEVYRSAKAVRRAREANAMPQWVDRAALDAIYAERERLVRETGVQYHVDHMEPLGGEDVCGLHVPWNLQIIPALENSRKSNRRVEWGP
jgi:hypothetical protein